MAMFRRGAASIYLREFGSKPYPIVFSRALLTVVAPLWMPWKFVLLTIRSSPFGFCCSLIVRCFLIGDRDLDFTSDGPHESTKFSGYSRYYNLLGFSFGPQLSVKRTQPELGFP